MAKLPSSRAKSGKTQTNARKVLKKVGQTKVARLSQHDLESKILYRCASSRDQLDKKREPGVKVVPIPLGTTGCNTFPRRWSRSEDGQHVVRGAAEWYVPDGADPTRRMLYLHGGTFVVWQPQDASYRSLGTRIAKACGVCVLAIDYRNAPEHIFPAAFDDSNAALEWIVSHGPSSPVEESPAKDVFVCGDSAGGNLAVAACVAPAPMVRRVLRGVIGLSAWLDLTASTPSYDTRRWDPVRCFGDAASPGTDRVSSRGEAEGYLGRGGVKKHGRNWRASPFFARASSLRNMPPALLHVGDFEQILDESVLFCRKMRKAGHKDATTAVYPRMWHVWHQYSEGGGERQPLAKALRAMREIGVWVTAHKSR